MAVVTTGDLAALDAFYRPDRKLAIIACAGGLRNAMTAGALVALRRRRLVTVPQVFVGVSSGIATLAYFMGGNTAPQTKVYSDDMSDKRLFSLRRRLFGGYPFDVAYVERVFRGSETGRGIKAAEVIAHPGTLYGVLAQAETGETVVVQATTTESVYQMAAYGAAVTGFARPLRYQGVPVTDGYFTDESFPLDWLMEVEEPTDVLIFAGGHYDDSLGLSSLPERLLYQTKIARASVRCSQ